MYFVVVIQILCLLWPAACKHIALIDSVAVTAPGLFAQELFFKHGFKFHVKLEKMSEKFWWPSGKPGFS